MADVKIVFLIPPRVSWKNSLSVLAFLEDSLSMLVVVAPVMTAPTTLFNTSGCSSVKRKIDSVSVYSSTADDLHVSMFCRVSRYGYMIESSTPAKVNILIVKIKSSFSIATYERAYSSVYRTCCSQNLFRMSFEKNF